MFNFNSRLKANLSSFARRFTMSGRAMLGCRLRIHTQKASAAQTRGNTEALALTIIGRITWRGVKGILKKRNLGHHKHTSAFHQGLPRHSQIGRMAGRHRIDISKDTTFHFPVACSPGLIVHLFRVFTVLGPQKQL
jgi:hypothetical protein